MNTTCIYALSDPRTPGEVRYIGKANNPAMRLRAHVCNALRGFQSHIYAWMRKLAREGVRPQLSIIDRVPASEWQLMERYWIAMYRDAGYDLTNTTKGGEGIDGLKHSQETRLKMSSSRMGHKIAAETRAAISAALMGHTNCKGRAVSEKTRAAISASLKGHKHTEESKRKMSETKQAKKARKASGV